MLNYGDVRFDVTLQPVSGKAIPVMKGEVMRITQVQGEQCVDFNSFNLHDYKEYMDVSSCRGSTGFRPDKRDIIFSNPPRFRPMIGILEMPSTCVTDVLGRSCHGVLFEASHGFDVHTSCQDTLAETIAEYALTPDDVHHSFNLWMNTEWDSAGKYQIVTNTGKEGDYVDLLACFDQLMVPITCGSGDTYNTSNFSFKPIQAQVFEASADTAGLADKIIAQSGSFKNNRKLDQYRVKEIKADRELTPVPDFKPNYINYPIKEKAIDVPLDAAELEAAQRLVEQGQGRDVADVVRRGFMHWYLMTQTATRKWAYIPASWL